jgi:hypothetical protein
LTKKPRIDDIEESQKKDKEETEYQNAMLENEFDIESIAMISEGEKTEEEVEAAQKENKKEEEIEIKRSKKRKRSI